MHTDGVGKKRKRCKFLFYLSPCLVLLLEMGCCRPWTVQGVWSCVSPILPFQAVLPAVPSCVRAIPAWRKAHSAAAEQQPEIQGRRDGAGMGTQSTERVLAAHEHRELHLQLGSYLPRQHEQEVQNAGKEAKEKGVLGPPWAKALSQPSVS